jgi:hypothetical protein
MANNKYMFVSNCIIILHFVSQLDCEVNLCYVDVVSGDSIIV